MTFFRRRLRLWAAVWFLFQGASLSAIVPRDCCATHGQASHEREHVQQQEQDQQQPSCHKAVPVTPDKTVTPDKAVTSDATATADKAQCPMRGADGKPCPMHRTGHAHHADGSSTETGGAPMCSMRAICTGPMDALVVLLVQPGVLPTRAAFPVDLHVDDAAPQSPARLIHGLFSPDLPPPRA